MSVLLLTIAALLTLLCLSKIQDSRPGSSSPKRSSTNTRRNIRWPNDTKEGKLITTALSTAVSPSVLRPRNFPCGEPRLAAMAPWWKDAWEH